MFGIKDIGQRQNVIYINGTYITQMHDVYGDQTTVFYDPQRGALGIVYYIWNLSDLSKTLTLTKLFYDPKRGPLGIVDCIWDPRNQKMTKRKMQSHDKIVEKGNNVYVYKSRLRSPARTVGNRKLQYIWDLGTLIQKQ